MKIILDLTEMEIELLNHIILKLYIKDNLEENQKELFSKISKKLGDKLIDIQSK